MCGKKVGHTRNKVCWECRIGPAPVLRDMSPNNLAWLAGLIEGEGYLGIVRGRGIVRVAMTDADVVERLRVVSGVGLVNELPRRHGVTRAVVSGDARHPVRFTLRWALGGDRRTARYAQTGAAVIPPPQSVRREGVEPSRPKAPVPGTGAAASYATSASG
jgi:hypothetical protein